MGVNRLPLGNFLNFVATPFFSSQWLILVLVVPWVADMHEERRERCKLNMCLAIKISWFLGNGFP